MTRLRLLLVPLALVVLLGCPPGIIDLSYYYITTSSTAGAGGTGGAGTGGMGSGGAATSVSGTGGAPLCMAGATASCYTGPAGTEDVGACQTGAQTCAPDGMSWGPCVGDVVPQPENCATPEDEDCDGQTPACPEQGLQWAKQFFNFDHLAWAQNVGVDAAGNMVVVGWSDGGPVDFGGGGGMGPPAGYALVVAKLDGGGNHVWSKGFNFNSNGTATFTPDYMGASVDSLGNVLLTGWAEPAGSFDFGGGPLTGMFVAKLDANGHHVWSKQFAGGMGGSVVVDSAGNVFLAGGIQSSVDFGGGPLINTSPSTSPWFDIFAAKLDAVGNHVWSRDCGQGEVFGHN